MLAVSVSANHRFVLVSYQIHVSELTDLSGGGGGGGGATGERAGKPVTTVHGCVSNICRCVAGRRPEISSCICGDKNKNSGRLNCVCDAKTSLMTLLKNSSSASKSGHLQAVFVVTQTVS